MDINKDLLTNFEKFKSGLSYPYGRSYFADEVVRILYNESYVVYIAQFEKKKLVEYALFDNYQFILDSEKIEDAEMVTLVSIRHFDIYIEYLLTYDFKILKSNLKNIDFKNSFDSIKKIFQEDEIIFYKGRLLNSKNLFEIEKSGLDFENRDKVIGNYVFNNTKYYFKPNNMLVYIVNENVMFGNYYFLDNFIKLYFDNAKEFELPGELYYEFNCSEEGLLLSNENYGHFYNLKKI